MFGIKLLAQRVGAQEEQAKFMLTHIRSLELGRIAILDMLAASIERERKAMDFAAKLELRLAAIEHQAEARKE